MLRRYRTISTKYPLRTAFATCFIKGSAADLLAQTVVENKSKSQISWRRNLSFAFFSGAYLGIAQHGIYNVIFTRAFGSSQTFQTAVKKVAADFFIHVPFVYIPLYYAFEQTVVFDQNPAAGIDILYGKDSLEIIPVMETYAMIWPGVHLINFMFVPMELRIAVIATVSFAWLTILSSISHGTALLEDENDRKV